MPHGPRCVFILAISLAIASASASSGAIELPIVQHVASGKRDVLRRSKVDTAIGLGDYFDISYSVLLSIGPVQTPLLLDSGSSDLWVITDACVGNCSAATPGGPAVFPESALNPMGVYVQLNYGDSHTQSFASGPVGEATTALAGLAVDSQMFVAVNETDTPVRDTGMSGIFGLGFPFASMILAEVYKSRTSACTNCRREPRLGVPSDSDRREALDWRSLAPEVPGTMHDMNGGVLLDTMVESLPFFSRAVETGMLAEPMISIALQRDTVDPGGNLGSLTVGGLPSTVKESALTWAPVRLYTPAQGVLPPSISPTEEFPLAWEVAIDNVYLDGQILPRTNLTPSNISITALIDTGNSLIRGPADLVSLINELVASPTPLETFDCSAHSLAFSIGGQIFTVDPRDLLMQSDEGTVGLPGGCQLNLASTDPPKLGSGYLYSWSLGIPFMKGVFTAFYYGNITNPNSDRPRMGFLSTVPADAVNRLNAAIATASAGSGDFVSFTQDAPATTYAAEGIGSGGVPMAPTGSFSTPDLGNAASSRALPGITWVVAALILSVAIIR